MTDKQIVDVTQCPCYREGKVCTYLPFKSKCEGDCNWTAYKEMEEQLDLLKFDYAELEKRHNDGFEQFKKLKAENKELRKAYARLNSLYNDNCNFMGKLEKTLTEIKTDILYIREGISYFWVIDKCDEILQKISEVE